MTLQDVTGFESGGILYPGGEIAILNWSSIHGIPRLLEGVGFLGLDEDLDNYQDCKPPKTLTQAMIQYAKTNGNIKKPLKEYKKGFCGYYLPDYQIYIATHNDWA